MMTLVAAALAAAAPAAPAATPAEVHAQHSQHMQQGQQHSGMADMKGCCCKDKMKAMQSGHDKAPMQDHQEHGGQ